MYHTISISEGHPYTVYGISLLRDTLLTDGKPNMMNSNGQRDPHLDMSAKFQLDTLASITIPHPDCATLPNPAVNSVWLEQGEYFFDDEFAVPFDTNLCGNHINGCDGAPPSCMTQSLNVELSTAHGPLQIDQSQSDSCIFTPGDSGESGLASAQTERTHSSAEADVTQLNRQMLPKENSVHSKDNKGQPQQINGNSVPLLGTKGAALHAGFPRSDCQQFSKNPNYYPQSEQDGVIDSDPLRQNQLLNGMSVTGSQASGQSGSTSWMQMIMERSNNPHLQDLLNRTAAAVDYKLAYTETFHTDSSLTSSIRQLMNDRSPLLCNNTSRGLSRSLSQGNMLTAASLAGLRHALDQAAQYLPKNATKSGATPHVRSVGVTAELTVNGDSGPATGTSSCAEVTTSNTTTWAQKHGSRESLKRKSSRNTESPVIPAPTTGKSNLEAANPWREMKKASGTLITWNQLKRTIKGNQPTPARATTVRESRKEQHQHANLPSDATSELLSDNLNPRVKQASENGSAVRSRSQPVSSNHYMHRFSGTLLEIFMRAKVEEMAFPGSAGADRAVTLGQTTSLDQAYDFPGTTQADTSTYPHLEGLSTTHGRHNSESKADIVTSRSESDKHPLLRGDRILPQKWYPHKIPDACTNQINGQRFVCNFGAQFPPASSSDEGMVTNTCNTPQSSNRTSPIWSNGLPVQRTGAALRGTHYPFSRHSHPRNPSLPVRPQSFAFNKPAPKENFQERTGDLQSSPGAPLGIAACLTASAGPDSPYMAALRADYVADGYSAGWLGNPRASIAYPGLGVLSIPRPSRLTSASFLSHTLPDLSFLSQAAEEEERKGTPTMSKRRSAHRCFSRDTAEHCCCPRCGCRSLSTGRTHLDCPRHKHGRRGRLVVKSDRPEGDGPTGVSSESNDDQHTSSIKGGLRPDKSGTTDHHFPTIPDLVMGHKASDPKVVQQISQRADVSNNAHHTLGNFCHADRSTSEPDLSANPMLNSSLQNAPGTDCTQDRSCMRPNTLMTSSTQDCWDGWGSSKSSEHQGMYDLSGRPKKSVSFSGKIRLLRLQGLSGQELDNHSPASPEPRVIPRNWGLYGQETPLAEFNPRNSPGRDANHGNEFAQQSDVDVRYHAMVNDVIKAVQETVAYYSTATDDRNPPGVRRNGRSTQEPLPFSTIAALGSTGRQPLLAVIGPLTVLLSDGLLPPPRPIFMTKPRTRLWQMVEESCRPGPHLTGVAYHVLSDAVSQVKSLPNVTLEKAKFKAFLCACLNAKAVPMWLNAVVANETLLRRFYCEDAFVRQCRSSQRGLHADLMTHLEQLLAFPFNLDLAVEARKPLVDPNSVAKTANNETNAQQQQQQTTGAASKGDSLSAQLSRTTSKCNIPPAVVMTRKQPFATGSNVANRARFSPPPLPAASQQNPTVHHYPQHHLPGQRTSVAPTSRPGASARFTRPGQNQPGEESGASSASSDVPATTDLKLASKRGPTGCNVPAQSTSVNPPARGRFKTALSTFRRGTAASTGASPSKLPDTAAMDTTRHAGKRCGATPLTDSESTKQNSNAATRSRSSSTALASTEKPKVVSKLKPPSTVVGRR